MNMQDLQIYRIKSMNSGAVKHTLQEKLNQMNWNDNALNISQCWC